jgi:hypothetical protein
MKLRCSPVLRRRRRHSATALIAAACVAVASSSCSRKENPTPQAIAPPSAVAPSASAAQAAALASSAAQKSWCAGAWAGTYRAAAHRIELPTNRGGIPEWKADDGKAFVGPGTIELTCAEDGTVTGSTQGALGEHEIRGASDETSLHARFVPKSTTPPGLSGTVALTRAGAEVTGDLQASTPDGRVARTATVTLSKRGE